jgi:nucleotide-binding universal stress UspA family protein
MQDTIDAILFPTDFSELSTAALPLAMDLADKYDAELHCLYVVEEPQIYSSLEMGSVAIPTSGELMQSAESRMDKFATEFLAKSPHGHSTKVLIGHAATEIVDYAKAVKAGLIVMTTHGYSGVKHLMLGSTTEDVLRHAACPVLSIRGGD